MVKKYHILITLNNNGKKLGIDKYLFIVFYAISLK